MPRCLIAAGSNVGDRAAALDFAVEQLDGDPNVRELRCSRWLETAPVGGPLDQGAFLNGALAVESSLPPLELLNLLLAVERDWGRQRRARWGPRTLDLDLLLYGDQIVRTADLETPHPRMSVRRFVMTPAAEAAPEMVHPTIGWTLAQIADHLATAPPVVAVFGERPRMVERVSQAASARVAGARLVDLRRDEDRARLADFQQGGGRDQDAAAWIAPLFSDDEAPPKPPRVGVLIGDEAWLAEQTARVARQGWGPRLAICASDDSPATLDYCTVEVAAAAGAMR